MGLKRFLIVALAALTLSPFTAAQEDCDTALEREWFANSGGRDGFYDPVAVQPSPEEKASLRATIDQCKANGTHFKVRAGPAEEDATATISLMLLAVALDEPEILDQLVSEGHAADGLPNYFGSSTLSFAVWRQVPKSIWWALHQGVDPNLADVDGMTALMYATQRPQDQVASIYLLIGAGADVNAENDKGVSPLAISIRSGRFDSAAMLYEAGANAERAKDFLLNLANKTSVESARDEILENVARFVAEVEKPGR